MSRAPRRRETEPAEESPSDLHDLHRMPGHLIRRCHQILVGLFLEDCKKFKITPRQFAILNVLSSHPGIEQTTLAGLVAMDRSTLGSVVYRMEKAGQVSREDDESDRRIKRMFLTPEGNRLYKSVLPLVWDSQNEFLEPLSKQEREFLMALLDKLANVHNMSSRAPLRSLGAELD